MRASNNFESVRELIRDPSFKTDFATSSEHLARIKYRRKGMFPSEIMAFCALARILSLNQVFESGMAMGYSTECLAGLLRVPVTSTDLAGYGRWQHWYTRFRLMRYPHLKVIRGNSKRLIPRMLEAAPAGDRIGVLIDGPKGQAAVDLAKRLAQGFSQIKLIGIHDLGQGRDLEFQSMAKELGWRAFVTDNEAFRNFVDKLDDEILTRYNASEALKKYPMGPGIGLCWTH